MKVITSILTVLITVALPVVVSSNTNPALAATPIVVTNWDSRLDKVTTGKDGLILWVDIKRQRLSVFKKSTKKFITSYQIITGKDGYQTPTGSFFINSNREYDPDGNNIELRGSYGSAYVQIWNPFVGNSIAFHNAPWRQQYEFGSTARRGKFGSHGCVNMDLDDAKDLWKRTSNGTRVIVTNN